MTDTWHRLRGPANYKGYVLEFVRDGNVYRAGHGLLSCLLFLTLFRLGGLHDSISGVKLMYRDPNRIGDSTFRVLFRDWAIPIRNMFSKSTGKV